MATAMIRGSFRTSSCITRFASSTSGERRRAPVGALHPGPPTADKAVSLIDTACARVAMTRTPYRRRSTTASAARLIDTG